MADDRKKWEEWLNQGEQEYKPARRERRYFAIGGGLLGMVLHLTLSAIPQSAWRRFGWQRALISIALLLAIGVIATAVDRWHLGMIERNNYYSWGITEAYQAKYEMNSIHPLLGTFSFPSEKAMYVVPSDALAHRIFSWAATLGFSLAGFGILLVIWLFWKYPDAFADGDFRDDKFTFGPDLTYHEADDETQRQKHSVENPPASAPPTGYTGFGRSSGGPKTIEAPRNRSF